MSMKSRGIIIRSGVYHVVAWAFRLPPSPNEEYHPVKPRQIGWAPDEEEDEGERGNNSA
jgi:hypothetical protein